MGVIARSDVHVYTDVCEDCTLPLPQSGNCELQKSNALQGCTLAAWQYGVTAFFFLLLRFSRLRRPVFHQGRVKDCGHSLRSLHFSAALLTKALKFVESGFPCWTVAVRQRWQRRLWEAE